MEKAPLVQTAPPRPRRVAPTLLAVAAIVALGCFSWRVTSSRAAVVATLAASNGGGCSPTQHVTHGQPCATGSTSDSGNEHERVGDDYEQPTAAAKKLASQHGDDDDGGHDKHSSSHKPSDDGGDDGGDGASANHERSHSHSSSDDDDGDDSLSTTTKTHSGHHRSKRHSSATSALSANSSANATSATSNYTYCNTTCDCSFGERCSNTTATCVALAGGGDDDNATVTPHCGNSSYASSQECITSNDCSVGYRCSSNLTCVVLANTNASAAVSDDTAAAREGDCQSTADCDEGYRCDQTTLTCVELADTDDRISVALLNDDDGRDVQANNSAGNVNGAGDPAPTKDVGAHP